MGDAGDRGTHQRRARHGMVVEGQDFPQLRDAALRYALGSYPVWQLPELAQEALAAGVDSASLRTLAGESPEHSEDLALLFLHALDELGVPMLSREAAAYELATRIAEKIIRFEISEFDGGRAIWKEIVDRLDHPKPKDLWVFMSNTSAIEDLQANAEGGGASNPELIGRYEREIRRAAQVLIDRRG